MFINHPSRRVVSFDSTFSIFKHSVWSDIISDNRAGIRHDVAVALVFQSGVLFYVFLEVIVIALVTSSPTCQKNTADLRRCSTGEQRKRKEAGTGQQNAWLSSSCYLIRARAPQWCLKHEPHTHLARNLTEVRQGRTRGAQPKWRGHDH